MTTCQWKSLRRLCRDLQLQILVVRQSQASLSGPRPIVLPTGKDPAPLSFRCSRGLVTSSSVVIQVLRAAQQVSQGCTLAKETVVYGQNVEAHAQLPPPLPVTTGNGGTNRVPEIADVGRRSQCLGRATQIAAGPNTCSPYPRQASNPARWALSTREPSLHLPSEAPSHAGLQHLHGHEAACPRSRGLFLMEQGHSPALPGPDETPVTTPGTQSLWHSRSNLLLKKEHVLRGLGTVVRICSACLCSSRAPQQSPNRAPRLGRASRVIPQTL